MIKLIPFNKIHPNSILTIVFFLALTKIALVIISNTYAFYIKQIGFICSWYILLNKYIDWVHTFSSKAGIYNINSFKDYNLMYVALITHSAIKEV